MSKKIIKYQLLWLIFIVSSNNILSFSKTNKTFLATRPQNFYLPIELSLFATQKYSLRIPKHRSILEVAPFYTTSFNNINQYFLYDNKRALKVGQGTNIDVDNQYLKFNETSAENLSGTIKIKPKVQTFGFFINYFIKLDDFIKRASVEILSYVCRTSTNPNFKVNNSKESSIQDKTIQDYFKGEPMLQLPENLEGTPEMLRDLQDPLTNGKMNGSVHDSGLADITLKLSYDIMQEHDFVFRLSTIILVPTNNGSKSEFLFEPRIGDANHWGLGLGFSGKKNIFEKCEYKVLDLIYDARILYLFNAYEERILGLKNVEGKILNWSQYLLLGEVGFPKVIPAANALTQNVKVFPGAIFEGAVMLSYQQGAFLLNCGYDMWLRQKEKVKIKDKWNNQKYGLVGSNYADDIIEFANEDTDIRDLSLFQLDNTNLTDTIKEMNPSGATAAEQGFITKSQITKNVAQTPGLFSNMFFIALGYKKEIKNNIVAIGVGASIELAYNKNSLSQSAIWVKSAISF